MFKLLSFFLHLCCKAATDNILQIIEAHPNWPVHPPPRLASWCPTFCRHSCAVERGLVVGFCGQPHYCYRPYYPTAKFPSPSSRMVSDEPFPGRSRPMSNLHKWGLAQSPSCDCGQQQTMSLHCWHVPINKIWRQTESTPRRGWWCSNMAGIYSDCSTREIIVKTTASISIKFRTTIKTCKWSSLVVQIHTQQIQADKWPLFWKTIKLPYLQNCLTHFDEIWHCDAHMGPCRGLTEFLKSKMTNIHEIWLGDAQCVS